MTQQQTIARHIVQYGSITRNTAIGMHQISRLAAVINALAKRGIPIVSEPIVRGKRVVDWKYSYRQDYLDKLRALQKANAILEQYGWKKVS